MKLERKHSSISHLVNEYDTGKAVRFGGEGPVCTLQLDQSWEIEGVVGISREEKEEEEEEEEEGQPLRERKQPTLTKVVEPAF